MKLSLLEWIERSVLAVWEKIADFLAKDREARKAAPEHAADPLIIIPIPKNRTYLAFFGILMLFFILAGRTFYLQVFNNDFLQNEGEKRFARTITIQGPRGEILDRNGIVLASSQPCRSVWADPALVPRSTKEEKQQLRELAKLLGIKHSELLKKLDHSSSPNFVYLARNRRSRPGRGRRCTQDPRHRYVARNAPPLSRRSRHGSHRGIHGCGRSRTGRRRTCPRPCAGRARGLEARDPRPSRPHRRRRLGQGKRGGHRRDPCDRLQSPVHRLRGAQGRHRATSG